MTKQNRHHLETLTRRRDYLVDMIRMPEEYPGRSFDEAEISALNAAIDEWYPAYLQQKGEAEETQE